MAESGSVQTQPPGCIKNEMAETISRDCEEKSVNK